MSVKDLQDENLALAEKVRTLQGALERSKTARGYLQNQVNEFELTGQSPTGPLAFPTFNGEGPLQSFLDDFNVIARSYNLDDPRKAQVLARCLKGHAFEVYKTLTTGPNMPTYANLCQSLKDHFQALQGPSYGSASFYTCRQLPQESVVDFYTRLKRLAKTIYPNTDAPMPDQQLLEQFIRGLPLPLRKVVVAKEPANPEAAFQAACKAQSQMRTLLDEADGVSEVSGAEISRLEQKVNDLTEALAKLNPNPGHTRNFPTPFPRPNHHLPQRMYRQPSPNPGPRRSNSPRCYRCNKLGHFASACRSRLPNEHPQRRPAYPPHGPPRPSHHQINEFDDNPELYDQPTTAEPRTPRPSGNRPLSPHHYMFLAVCCLLLPPAQAQKPMICPTNMPGLVFDLPQSFSCNLTSLDQNPTEPVNQTLQLYKRNVIEYHSEAYLCYRIKQTIWLKTWLFGIEHERKTETTDIPVYPNQCQEYARRKQTPVGTLTKSSPGLFTTNNKLNYKVPSWTADECCKWWEYSVENIYVQITSVYKHHESPQFQCPAAAVSDCPNYFAGACQLGPKALVWTPEPLAKCKYIPSLTLNGKQIGPTWLSLDGQIALTYSSNLTEVDCNRELRISDQSIPFSVVQPSSPRPKRSSLPNEKAFGVVTSDILAAELEALHLRVIDEIHFSYRQSMQTVCRGLQHSLSLLSSTLLANPIFVMRTLLNNTYLTAKAGGHFIEVWPCKPIMRKELTFLPQPSPCTSSIPVEFSLAKDGPTNKGYLDPNTLIISHHGPLADCTQVGTIPIQLYRQVYNYNATSGHLSRVTDFKSLPNAWSINIHPLLENWATDYIVRPVIMYTWQELKPENHLNQLLKSLALQSQVLKQLGLNFDDSYSANQSSAVVRDFITNTYHQALASVTSWFNLYFHIWVTIVCTLISVQTIYKLFMAARNHPAFTHTASRLRQWRRPKPKSRTPCTSNLPSRTQSAVELELASLRDPAEVNGLIDGKTMIELRANNLLVSGLIDTGATCTLLSYPLARKLGLSVHANPGPTISITGHLLDIAGEAKVKFTLANLTITHPVKVFKQSKYDVVLGTDFLRRLGHMQMDLAGHRVCINNKWLPLIAHNGQPALNVYATESKQIPPRSMSLVYCKTNWHAHQDMTFLFEQSPLELTSCICPRTLVSGSSFPIRIVNPTYSPVSVTENLCIGSVSPAEVINSTNDFTPPNPDLPGLDLSESALAYDERDQLTNLLVKYKHLFAADETQVPGTNAMTYQIKLQDPHMAPIKQRAYRVPQSKREEIDKHIDNLLRADIIQPSCSPWASPVVLVSKRNGGSRLAIDYRKLNDVTISDAYPLPRVDDALEFLDGAKYLTTLDCFSGFHQVPLHPDTQPLTAFITGSGLYEYKCLPFGVKQGPSCFQRLMNFVLSGLLFTSAMIYLDDILVAGKTFEEMLLRLEEVFVRLDQYNIRLKLKKCQFARDHLPFLGFILTPEGIRPDPANVSRLIDAPAPKSVRDVRSFLGAINFYRKFIPDCATIARPLYALLKKAAKMCWSEKCEQARQSLISKLTSAPILVYPNFSRGFILTTDASMHGCGAVLAQNVDGREAPIAFFSRNFSKAESKYSTVERELLAVVLALKHFKHLVYGHKISVYSDQKSLSWGVRQTDSPRMQQWLQKLQDFDIKVYYRPGKKMGPADYLSRIPALTEANPAHLDCLYSTDEVASLCELSVEGGRELFSKEQLTDPVIATTIKIKTSQPTADIPSQTLSSARKLAERSWYHPEIGCLYFGATGRSLLVVPESLKRRILLEAHNSVWSGHMSVEKTLSRISEKFFWPGVRQDVETHVAACHDCLRTKFPTRPTREPMIPISSNAPWQHVVMDVLGPLPTSRRGHKYILVIMDRFTKWPECKALRTQTAAKVAEAFIDLVVTRHGVPSILQTDLGSNFCSALVQEVGKILGMKHKFSTAYHPQSQGLCERFNRTLLSLLKLYVSHDQRDWCEYLNLVLLAYRTSKHSSTNYTPFEMVYGRQAQLPLHFITPTPATPDITDSSFAGLLGARLARIHDLASDHMTKASSQQKAQRDKKVHPSKVIPGDLVYVHVPHSTPGISPKLASTWHGPLLVLDRKDPNVQVEWPGPSRRHDWVHLDRTKPARHVDGMPPLIPDPDCVPVPTPRTAEIKPEHQYALRPRH